MANGVNIDLSNKVIEVEDIKKVANYIEQLNNKYLEIYNREEEKNKYVDYLERKYEYKFSLKPEVEYKVQFNGQSSITNNDYYWFINNLENPKEITEVTLRLYIEFQDSSNTMNRISIHINIDENQVYISIDGAYLESEINKIYSDISNIFNNLEPRYDKTIKNKTIRVQSFCFTFGMIFGYIALILLLVFFNNLPDAFKEILKHGYVIVPLFFLISGVLGNIFTRGYIIKLYRNILKDEIFVEYDEKIRDIRISNLESYKRKNEVQIGKFTYAKYSREKIEKIFKLTNKIILGHAIVGIILMLIIK